jgi:hypothetical protein
LQIGGNVPYTDNFDFPYVSFRFNFGCPTEAPIYTEGPGEVFCLGFGREDDLRKHAPAAPPVAARRWPANGEQIAIKECSPAELLDDPVVGLVTMSDAVESSTSQASRLVGRLILAGA